MKITKLTIDNIRSHVHTEIPMDRLTMIQGPNHSGKSSIEMAIEFAFTGRCEITDDGGKGQADLLRLGEDKGAVTLEMGSKGQANVIYRATLSKASGRDVGVRTEDKTWDGTSMLKVIARDRNILSCLCNSRYFVSLAPAAQKNLLAGIILPEQYTFPEEKVQLAGNAGLIVNWALPPFTVIGVAFKQAFDLRTTVNRDLKNHVIPQAPEAPEIDTDTIRTKLRELQNQRNESGLQRERMIQGYTAAKRELENLNSLLIRAEERKARAVADVDAAKQKQLSKAEIDRLKKTAADGKQAKKLDDELVNINAQITHNDLAIKKLEALGETCPTCSQGITEETFRMIADPLTELRAKLNRDQKAMQDQRKSLGDYEGAERKLTEHKLADTEVKAAVARLNDCEEELKGIARKLAETPELQLPDTTEVDEALTRLDQRIEGGQEALTQAARAAELIIQRTKAKEVHTQLLAQQQDLEKLVDYFGPGDKGIKAKLIAEHIGKFEDSINATLHQWGYHAALALEPYGFTIARVENERFTGNPLVQLYQLSGSELMRFAIAFQVALALHSPYKFIVVDQADVFDECSTQDLYRALYRSQLDQAIVLATADEPYDTNIAPGAVWITLAEANEGTKVTVLRHNVAREAIPA